ncbi:RIPOR family member 3 isoform X2 [Scleropages formosus]|uniref:RIPOR family member 3 n=1 Tax=Scleropages formosus TaxID=113540 RepID=A0A8C9V3A6_SCLFO|nr:RIPOR family member 3 isoform X2 [Scleropages formosus]
MSVKLRFRNPAEGGVQRSRSFTGFSSLSSRRRASSAQSSLRSKGPLGKSPRGPPLSGRTGGSTWGPRPSRVDRVFQALRSGLREYLQNHQAEMDFLSSQQRDSKRNSRLEIRALERYMHRLEFHISKVEELYEHYCIQWRLCQGAVNMKKAFSLSPSSRASRDSLLELNRNHRHSLEDMNVMEGELEILLGELRIKMKGLVGFARLCPGDQYEVMIRLGRQRWRIKGKIHTDDQQSWDEEEMVFLPHIHENFEIKVTEVKGLVSAPVGVVTCESVGFFTARPQMMIVDITELGTIKLQLEVVWNPFDSGETKPVTTSPSKLSVPSRKGSIYSWTPPSTPSFTEKYFITMARQLQDSENYLSLSSKESRGVSLLSYLSESSQTFVPSIFGGSEVQISTDQLSDIADEQGKKLPDGNSEDWSPGSDVGPPTPGEGLLSPYGHSTPDILKQNKGSAPSTEVQDTGDKGTSVSVMEQPSLKDPGEPPPTNPEDGSREKRDLARAVSSLLDQLDAEVQQRYWSEPEMKKLEKQVMDFRNILKNELSLHKSSSTETLSVEEVLGSFDFLSTDFSMDELSSLSSMRLQNVEIGSFKENALAGLSLLPQDGPPCKKAENIPLTTGHSGLDQTLEIHLSICNVLLQQIKTSDSSLVKKELLEELSRQLEILENISKLSLEKNIELTSIKEMLPKAQRQKTLLSFWDECTRDSSIFCCSARAFALLLRKRFIHKVKAKEPGQVDSAFAQLLQQMQSSCRMVPAPRCSTDHVTVFQLFNYLTRWGVTDFGEHVSRLAKEMHLVSALESPKRRKALRKLKGKRIADLHPLGATLQLLAGLQMDVNHKVSQAASSCLCRASTNKSFRAKAVVYYTAILTQSDVKLQQAACFALKCLKAAESAEQVAELWRSADEELRNAARETVLSFGKKGHLAFQRMDNICCELQEELYRNEDTEITIL